MSQQPASDFDIVATSTSGTQLATYLNNLNNALLSCRSGTSVPPSAVAGTVWRDTTSSTTHIVKYYNGTASTELYSITVATGEIIYPLKDYIDDNFLANTGGSVKALTVADSASGQIKIGSTLGTGYGTFKIVDYIGRAVLEMAYSNNTGEAAIYKWNPSTTLVESELRFDDGEITCDADLAVDGDITIQNDLTAFRATIGNEDGPVDWSCHIAQDSNTMVIVARNSGIDQTQLSFDADGVTCDGEINGASIHATDGATGTFTTVDSKTVTVTDGIITSIV